MEILELEQLRKRKIMWQIIMSCFFIYMLATVGGTVWYAFEDWKELIFPFLMFGGLWLITYGFIELVFRPIVEITQ